MLYYTIPYSIINWDTPGYTPAGCFAPNAHVYIAYTPQLCASGMLRAKRSLIWNRMRVCFTRALGSGRLRVRLTLPALPRDGLTTGWLVNRELAELG
eukprot:11553570-Heterocapsa_arctica.AAC.1